MMQLPLISTLFPYTTLFRSFRIFLMSRKIILIKQELLLLVYELNRSGLLAENEKIRPILAQLEKLLLCDLSQSKSFSSCARIGRIFSFSANSTYPCAAREALTLRPFAIN